MNSPLTRLVVILHTQVGQRVLLHQPAEGVLELPMLDEDVVLWIKARRCLWGLEVEREPFLYAA